MKERRGQRLIVSSFEKSNVFLIERSREEFIKSRPRHCVSRTATQTEGILLVGGREISLRGEGRGGEDRPMKTFHPVAANYSIINC